MSANRQSIFDLLAIKATDQYLTVLHHYIDKINPNAVNNWWLRPNREDVLLHFSVINNQDKYTDYYQHWRKGQLSQYFDKHPVPNTLSKGAGQILSWVKAKAMEQELLRSAGLSFAPGTEDDSAYVAEPVSFLTKTRFIPSGRRPPTRRAREEIDCSMTPGCKNA